MELILDAAAEVFDEVGYEAATTNTIAARAGISPGSLYQFFANKQGIAEALADRYVALMGETHDAAFRAGLEGVAELPLPEMVDRVVDPLIEFNLAHPAAKSLLTGADLSPALAASTQQLHQAFHDQLEVLVAARVPGLSRPARRRVATVSTQIFKALLPNVLGASPRDRAAIVRELKTALVGYWTVVESPARTER
jgi:AcrR family transcriptional regulator